MGYGSGLGRICLLPAHYTFLGLRWHLCKARMLQDSWDCRAVGTHLESSAPRLLRVYAGHEVQQELKRTNRAQWRQLLLLNVAMLLWRRGWFQRFIPPCSRTSTRVSPELTRKVLWRFYIKVP